MELLGFLIELVEFVVFLIRAGLELVVGTTLALVPRPKTRGLRVVRALGVLALASAVGCTVGAIFLPRVDGLALILGALGGLIAACFSAWICTAHEDSEKATQRRSARFLRRLRMTRAARRRPKS